MSDQCSLCSTIPSILVSPERSSRVSELMSNNIPPSQSDRQFMQSLCTDYEDRVRQLDERVSRVAEALAVLTTERDKFLAHIEDTKAIMHPMRSLPDDVLYEIFSHCIPNWTRDNLRHGQCNSHDSLDTKNAPWAFSQVCSRWRNVVLRLPTLWSTVVLNFPKYRTKHQDHLLARLRILLERSRACDMTVIAATDYLPSFGIEHPMIALLRQTSHRWKYLRIWLTPAFMSAFFHLLPVNRLQQLAIHNGTMDSSDAPYLAESIKLDSAHQLINLRLSGRRPVNLNVTWAHIVDFDAINVFCEHVFSVLPQMVNVRSMKLACGPTRCPPDARPIALHRLKRLKVEEQTASAGGCIAAFLALLDAPILTSLHLLYPRAFSTPRLPSDFSGIGRITALRIIGYFGPSDSPCPDLVEFLKKTNKLTSIRMDMQRIPAGLLRAMVPSGGEAILRNLECLNLSYTGEEAYEVDPELVLLAGEARARPAVAVAEDGDGYRPLVQLRLPRHLEFDKADLASRWNRVSQKLTITVRGKRWKSREPNGGGASISICDSEVPNVVVVGGEGGGEDDTSTILG